MYQKQPRSLEELTERKMDITNKIVNGHNLDYLAMEKLQKSLKSVDKEILQINEELNVHRTKENH